MSSSNTLCKLWTGTSRSQKLEVICIIGVYTELITRIFWNTLSKRSCCVGTIFKNMASDLPVLLAAVSVLSALHLAFQARRVGWSRMKYKIMPPIVTGPPEFERTFRAHQNSVETYSGFLVLLWISGIFCSEVLAALGGLLYIMGREMYFTGYISESKKRLPGFYLVLCTLLFLTVMATFGILQSSLDKYLNIRIL